MRVDTELTNKEIEKGLTGGFVMLWEVYSSLEGDEEFENEKEKVKFGVKHLFDIRSIIEDLVEHKVAHRIVKIERTNEMNITDFRDEKEERAKIMKNRLRSLYDDTIDNQKEEDIEGYGRP